MLTKVVWMPPTGISYAEFEMPLFDPNEDGLFIDHVDGLGPVDDSITTEPLGGGAGEYFVGRHRGKRNIVLHFGLESDGHDPSAARAELIRTFYTVGDVMFWLRFEFDDRDPVKIEGMLETEESDPFTSDPDCQLSIICPKPNFISTVQSTATGMTDHDPDLVDMPNAGNRDVGFAVKIIPESGLEDHFANDLIYESKIYTGPTHPFTAISRLTVNGKTSDLTLPMIEGEEFWMDSRVGKKSIYIYSPDTGEVRNAMRGMTSDSYWPILYPGVVGNKFSISIPKWAQGVHPMPWTAYWREEFGSI